MSITTVQPLLIPAQGTSKKLPGKEVEFIYPIPSNDNTKAEQLIKFPLYVDMNYGIGGDVWPATQLFCNYFLESFENYTNFTNLVNNKTIVELGSGNGLVSILLEKAFPVKSVTVTDIEEHMNLIDYNLKLNNTEKCIAQEINWLDFATDRTSRNEYTGPKYDMIIALEW
jgi:hypothetical protein